MKNIVEVKNFKMVFGSKTVIKDLSYEVKKGEIFGFLGANGSGKTTTVSLFVVSPNNSGVVL